MACPHISLYSGTDTHFRVNLDFKEVQSLRIGAHSRTRIEGGEGVGHTHAELEPVRGFYELIKNNAVVSSLERADDQVSAHRHRLARPSVRDDRRPALAAVVQGQEDVAGFVLLELHVFFAKAFF